MLTQFLSRVHATVVLLARVNAVSTMKSHNFFSLTLLKERSLARVICCRLDYQYSRGICL